MKLIDVHTHLQFPQFDEDREEVVARARSAGIGVINVGTDLETSRAAVKLAETHPDMWATVGIHPADQPETGRLAQVFIELEELAKYSKVVAIGECGLDYFRVEDRKKRDKQKEIFERQIKLAKIVNKPLMVHCRPSPGTQDAYEDILQILNQKLEATCPTARPGSYKLSGNIHFFAGDWPIARKFLDLGCTLSFTGVITFANDYDEVIKQVPLDRIMIETDCPFVPPVPYRGKRNESSYLPVIADRLAVIKGLHFDDVATATLLSARRFFGLAPS